MRAKQSLDIPSVLGRAGPEKSPGCSTALTNGYSHRMASSGKVIGGTYMDSAVTTATFGGGIVIQSGFRGRRVDAETVAQWEEVPLDSRVAKTASAVGQAVAEAVLPRLLSKGASAAIRASIDSSNRPPRAVRIDWTDGKQPSLLKLPEDLFTHFELLLSRHRVSPAAGPIEEEVAVASSAVVVDPPAPAQTMSEQAFSLVHGFVKDRTHRTEDVVAAPAPDVTEQLKQLASLRDEGILTDQEFTAKKTELLDRM
jgi:hypothetical protein